MTREEIQDLDVPHEDREDPVNFLRISLGALGYNISYTVADLFAMNNKELERNQGAYNIRDSANLETAWHHKWENYQKRRIKNGKTGN